MMRLLFVEDCEDDALLAIAELRRRELTFESRIVQTLEAVEKALEEPWSAVISDYNLRSFNALDVLNLVRKTAPETPFIVVSGTIGEERAVDLIRAGANDYVSKDGLSRLPSALERELREADGRKRHRTVQAELSESQQRYSLMFERASIGIVNGDRHARIVDVNRRFAQILGYEAHELAGRTIFSLSHPDDVDRSRGFHERVISGEMAGAEYERRFVRKDGSIVWVTVKLTPVTGPDGTVDQIIGLIEDVSERRDAEARISLQALLLDSVRQAVVATDVEGQVIYWNRFAEEQFGWTAAEAAGRNLRELAPSDEYAVASPASLARLKGGEARARETVLSRRDRSRFAAWVTEAPIVRGGAMVGVIAIIQDIDYWKQAQARLELSERELAEAQRIARIGSWTYDIATGNRSWSDELFRLFGFEPGGAPPDPQALFESVHPDDRERFRAMFESALRAEPADAAEYRVLRPGGESRVIQMQSHAERPPGGKPRLVGVVRDVTETKLREKELQTLAIKHAAAANLGQLALGGVPIDQLFQQADAFAQHLLHGIETEVLRPSESGFLTISGMRQDGAAAGGARRSPMAEYVIGTNDAVIVEDAETEARFDASLLVSRGIRSAVAIPMSIGFDRPWGFFGVYSDEVRKFDTADVDFLESLATVLGQAVESDKARRALVESEENYRNVIQGAHEIIFTFSPEGPFVALNPAFDAITGLSSQEWIGRPVAELIVPRDRERVARLTAGIVEHQNSTDAEMSIEGARGEILLHVTSFPKVKDGKVSAIYGFARDITEERRLEVQRQQLTHSLQLILDSTAEGVFTIDVDRRFTAVNRSLTTILGWTAEELIGTVAHDVIHSGSRDGSQHDGDRCAIRDILSSGSIQSVTSDIFWRKDGTPVPVQYSAAPIVDGESIIGVVVTFTDMSERRKLEYKLEQATRLSSLGRLAATVAHEFNNVLMGISPFIEVLRRNPAPDRIETALDQIGRSVKRGKRITDDILRFTQPAEPARVAFDAGQWLQMLVTEARGILPPQISIGIDLPPAPVRVNADAHQLHQVFLNLVLNGRDAMPQGGRISIGLETPAAGAKYPFGTVENPERFAHFTVTDSGCGIPSTALQHVFEPLFTTKKSGTGLGLAVAHQIVHRHGGEVFVESEEGVGTSFHVFLPLSTKADATENAGRSVEAFPTRPRHLLLVEDDRSVAAGLTAMLTLEGIEVEVAESGANALASLALNLPDAVVLDVGLPDMEGTKVYEAIAERYPALPVVFSTGHGDPSQLEPFTRQAHVTALRKPYDTATLLRALEMVYQAAGRSTPE